MKKTNLWKRFVLIDALIVVSLVAVYAWFIMGDTASVSGMDEQVIDAGYIRISQDGGDTWEDGLDLDLGTAGIVHEMSGNGLDLYEPIYGMYNIEGYEKTDNDEYYIEKTFTFESDISQDVYLSDESFLRPSDLTKNFSDEGDFSCDYIAGALRVAFFEVTEHGYTPLCIWIPNPSIEYTGKGVNENGSVEDYYSYQIGTGVGDTVSIPTGGIMNGISNSDDGLFIWGTPEQTDVKPLLSFSTENNRPVRKSIMMRVWLEGTDRECVRALRNGKFKMYFKFETTGKEVSQ